MHISDIIIIQCFLCISSIRLWALTGQVLMEMVGHTAIVYSVDYHASGLIVSGSEDRFAKIWKGDCFWYSCFSCNMLFCCYGSPLCHNCDSKHFIYQTLLIGIRLFSIVILNIGNCHQFFCILDGQTFLAIKSCIDVRKLLFFTQRIMSCCRWNLCSEHRAPWLCLGRQIFGKWGYCDGMFWWSYTHLDSTSW